MFSLLKSHTYPGASILHRVAKLCPIGVDLGDDALTIAQLACDGNNVTFIAGASEDRPQDVISGSIYWQRWAIDTIHELTANSKFRGKDVIASIPSSELFIDNIKMPKTETKSDVQDTKRNIKDAIIPKIKQKLPFDPNGAMIKYIPADEDNVLVIAARREIIDRHLAIYENAGLTIRSIGVWPFALTNTYNKFFSRRKEDIEAYACLIDIEASYTNVVMCRHENLLFARSIPIGAKQINKNEIVTRFLLELTVCKRSFLSMYRKAKIERLVFLSGQAVDIEICAKIAKQLEVPAQMGDCLAAVKIAKSFNPEINKKQDEELLDEPSVSENQKTEIQKQIDRRNCQIRWATAFGLSLS